MDSKLEILVKETIELKEATAEVISAGATPGVISTEVIAADLIIEVIVTKEMTDTIEETGMIETRQEIETTDLIERIGMIEANEQIEQSETNEEGEIEGGQTIERGGALMANDEEIEAGEVPWIIYGQSKRQVLT